jgi:hypothetical protein
LRLYGLAKGFAFGFNRRGKPGFTPAANRHRDHPVDRFMPGRDLREALFNHPVKANAGKACAASVSAGSVCSTSPMDEVFTINTRIRYASSFRFFPQQFV